MSWASKVREVRSVPYLSPEGLRFKVLKRDGFACVYCGGRACDKVRLQVDHYVPWSQGGRTVLANLRTACGPCNRGKGAAWIA